MDVNSIAGFSEPFAALSHLIGALAFAGLGWALLRRSHGSAGRVALFAVWVFTSVFLLSMSGVYHMLPLDGAGRAVLGRLDQAAIFALIAGTHTPVQGLFFRGRARWLPLVGMWLAAVTGIVLFSVFYERMPAGLGTAAYLLLGWIAGVAGLVVWRRFGTRQLGLLIGGGVTYSLGAAVLALDGLVVIPGVIGAHELWHIAVLAAMTMHWRFMFDNAHYPVGGPRP